MSWDTIAAAIVIIGCLISLGTVLAKLIATLTRLDVTVNELRRAVDTIGENNDASHKLIFETLERQNDRLRTLENR